MPDDIDVGNVNFTASFFNNKPQIEMVHKQGQELPNVRSFIQVEKQKSVQGGSFYSHAQSNHEPHIQVYDEGQASFLDVDQEQPNIDVVNVDMINQDENNSIITNSLNVSQVSVQQKFEDEEPETGPNIIVQ